MITWSDVIPFTQGPLLTVHWKMFSPTPRPVTVVLTAVGSVITPVPLTKVHKPVAGTVKALPVRVAVLAGVQSS